MAARLPPAIDEKLLAPVHAGIPTPSSRIANQISRAPQRGTGRSSTDCRATWQSVSKIMQGKKHSSCRARDKSRLLRFRRSNCAYLQSRKQCRGGEAEVEQPVLSPQISLSSPRPNHQVSFIPFRRECTVTRKACISALADRKSFENYWSTILAQGKAYLDF